jgi:GTPase SAR1 family protein
VESESIKTVFTGLDGAGKSSIILSLMREISKIAIVKPTKSAKRRVYDFLGTTISEWDLGGQLRYREDYLENQKFFDLTDICLYVIDIQNNGRIEESLNYLIAITNQFIELKINPPIYVLFHKYDPDYVDKNQTEIKNTIQDLELKIRKIPQYHKFFFFQTSIYNMPTIISAMSSVLLSKFPKYDLLENTIEGFASRFKADGIEIIDNNSLIIASYYKDTEVKEALNSSTHYFLSLNDVLVKPKSSSIESNLMQVERYGFYFLFKQFTLKDGVPPYYLLLLKNDQLFNIEDFNVLVSILKEILYK